MNKLMSILSASMLFLGNSAYGITIFNSSGIERQILVQQFSKNPNEMVEVAWSKVEEKSYKITTILKPDALATCSLGADQSTTLEIMKECKSLLVTVYWGNYNTETEKWEFEKSIMLNPADYEKTEVIDNESLVLIHQPTQEDGLKIKLVGKKLGLVMQQKMIQSAFEKSQEAETKS